MWIILGRLLNRPFTKVLAGLWDLTEDVEVSRNSNSRIPSILIGPKVEEMILLECGKGPCHKKEPLPPWGQDGATPMAEGWLRGFQLPSQHPPF